MFDKEAAETLIGNWSVDDGGLAHSFFKEDDRLFFKLNSDERSFEVFYLPRHNKIIYEWNSNYLSIIKENGETVLVLNFGAELRKKD